MSQELFALQIQASKCHEVSRSIVVTATALQTKPMIWLTVHLIITRS